MIERERQTTVVQGRMPDPKSGDLTQPRHCPSCICGRRAPVQASGSIVTARDGTLAQGSPGYGPGTISWEEHLLAWGTYARRYGAGQSAERMAERGGFSFLELVDFLGRPPATWVVAR